MKDGQRAPSEARFPGLIGDGMALATAALKFADALVVLGSGLLAYALRTGQIELPDASQYFYALLASVLLTLLVFVQLALYRSWRLAMPTMMAGRVLLGWGVVLGVLASLSFLSKTGPSFSRLWFLYWAGLGACGLIGVRLLLDRALRWLHRRGIGTRRIAVLGPHERVAQVAERIRSGPWSGLQMAPVPEAINAGDLAALPSWLEDHGVAEVWLAWPMREEALIRESVRHLGATSVHVRWIPDIFAFRMIHHGMAELAGTPLLELSVRPLPRSSRLLKACLDKSVAATLLLLASPLMLLLAAGVRLSGPGPVIFRQQRQGWDGRPFEVWKFRSMRLHDAQHFPPQTVRGDARITRFGAFMRRTSLDELPQLFNVLQGRMSMVGPRPHALAHGAQYQDLVPNYLQRHRVKPGITGWAQVNGLRGETDTLEKMRKRVEFDLYYIQHWSLWLDLSIIAQTCVIVLFDRDAS
ncbi:undecaprenyl-phosphate glucose phosphotransferase [Paracidovorax cattleyae]|uniref:Putative colanic acid biosysnthesis UDP-glucose lipid carrier transferase n=1 Tax=Paracidovorax cattleyae TaxID=80868 RepID=A0A1H0W7D6_9BURK|nr:undecaprenyl-phosphate glucose phosphotransferase [Paracidovorax cattleyae]AVS73418.1 undecaprenyl-phosphate glucose phosphotransferase [Paracidovorax cattleyae]SDP86644.1 putative colanic acid biosysnthesis UDP-glucose lipid carrier transferase [Paracidovorax cattleyae]